MIYFAEHLQNSIYISYNSSLLNGIIPPSNSLSTGHNFHPELEILRDSETLQTSSTALIGTTLYFGVLKADSRLWKPLKPSRDPTGSLLLPNCSLELSYWSHCLQKRSWRLRQAVQNIARTRVVQMVHKKCWAVYQNLALTFYFYLQHHQYCYIRIQVDG